MRKSLYGNGNKKIIWTLLLFFVFALIAVLAYLSGNFRTFVINSQSQLADSFSAIPSGAIVTTNEDYSRHYINLEEVAGAKTLTTPTSCVPPDVLKRYPDMPKNWAFNTKCGQSYMSHSIHSDRAAMAKFSIGALDERILLVEESIREVVSQKISKINDLPAGEGMPIGEILSVPYPGASLSTQCVKDAKGQVLSYALLAGKYVPSYSSLSGYSPIQQNLNLGSISSKNKIVLVSAGADNRLKFFGFTVSANIRDTGERCGPFDSLRLYDVEFGPFVGEVCSPEITVAQIIADTTNKLNQLKSLKSSMVSQLNKANSGMRSLENAAPECYGGVPPPSGEK